MKWSERHIRPEVAEGLSPILNGMITERFLTRLIRSSARDVDGVSLLPDPWRLVVSKEYVLICVVQEGELVSVRTVPTDRFIPDDLLAEVEHLVPEDTELAWTAEAGADSLRGAFLDALRLRKLKRRGSEGNRVYLDWPYYQLRFSVHPNSEEAPTLTLAEH